MLIYCSACGNDNGAMYLMQAQISLQYALLSQLEEVLHYTKLTYIKAMPLHYF